MRRIIVLLASVMFAVLLVSGIAGAQTEGAVLDAHAELHPEAGGTDTGLHDPLIQTFLAEHTGFVTEVTALIAVGPPDTSITAQIVKVPDSLQGQPEILAETQTTAPELSTWKKGTKLFSFDAPAHIEAGETYGLLLQTPGSGSGGRWYHASDQWQHKDVYENGAFMYIDPQDNTWKVLRYYETSDGVFSIYVVPDPTMPTSKADCKNGGWKDLGFKNQGQCINTVNQTA
jgi:hypothetical protein